MNIDKKIKGEDTFFTDEKIFILNTQLIGKLIKLDQMDEKNVLK